MKNLTARKTLFEAIFVFIFLVAFVAIAFWQVYSARVDSFTKTKMSLETSLLELQQKYIVSDIDTIISDVNFLTSNHHIVDFLQNTAHLEKFNIIDLQENLREFSIARKVYDQIRIIGLDGMELVRINYNDGNPSAVAQADLQNKSGRYYFEDTLKLNEGEIFISPLDLNIEKGVIEFPLKPMIRVGAPVFDYKGRKMGIALVNYFGRALLDKFMEIGKQSTSDSYLLNSDGYLLEGGYANQRWGFMFDEVDRFTFAEKYPDVWRMVLERERGQFITPAGLYTFDTVKPLAVGAVSSTGSTNAYAKSEKQLSEEEYFWKLISFVPSSLLYAEREDLKKLLLNIFLAIAIFIGIVDYKISLERYRRRQVEMQREELLNKLHVMATTDELTGLTNRHNFFEKLETEFSRAIRHKYPLGCAMIDLDHFKSVNDTYGHPVGDKLLREVADCVKSSIRQYDLAARYGGEEFICIFAHSDVEGSKAVAERIRQNIEKMTCELDDGRVLKATASIGVAFLTEGMDIEQLIDSSDQALYRVKENGRNRVEFN
ncbi:MAG: hypothetical protein C0608_02850 [Deltaproteobacteria bacterium]|nr:MAG: hypothetical protein C0608_02850 [Deltaproteobacteria bacterium]